ncbi:MAG: purine-binding chemotaxis protein CheW [Sedimentisphaerales bacterium]|nr:purine-binding chemotaxis protein CheW [Sedimentisphaerales bacterium]
MTNKIDSIKETGLEEFEFTTFYVGDLLMGVDIQQVQEINRQLDTTEVPHAPECVRGIVNLRGEVVTVLDLRVILGLDATEINDKNRNVIIKADGENIGLMIDRIADVVYARLREIEPAPANISGVDGRFIKGVYKLDSELLVILDIDEVIKADKREGPEM